MRIGKETGDDKMKTMNKLLFLCIALFAFGVNSTAQGTWKLSRNVLLTSNEISFNEGSNGVWYFMQSSSPKHDPKTYKFLTDYSAPCKTNGAEALIPGVDCWRNPNLDPQGNNAPLVGVNFTYHIQFPNLASGDPFGIPARSVWMHPGYFGELAIVGWKSPITGTVNVSGFFSDLDPNCGNGVIWSVDKSALSTNQTLTTGTIANGAPSQTYSLTGISIGTGQVLYFIVDSNQDYFCDSTGVDVTIKSE
jgi:hypothetical protein